jgi:site-specific recombinase XerD
MAATITKLETRRRGCGTTTKKAAGGPTVRAAIDAFLDTPKIKGNPNTLRAYTNVLDRTAGVIDADRTLSGVADGEIADSLTELWGDAKPATWNRNRAAVGSWLAWCATTQHWAAPALPGSAERRRENNDDTKAMSRSRIDRLCRRRDVPLREKTLWRMLYESASRASAVLALNIEDLDLPNKQARITAKGGDIMWITWGTVRWALSACLG